jgi:hypothetical protein
MNRDQARAFVLAVLQVGALVAIAALQDPEIRRNVVWGLEWTRDRVRAILVPDDDEPPAPAVSAVLAEAREITRGASVRPQD